MDRFNSMSAQADIIAKKKAEIEAKLMGTSSSEPPPPQMSRPPPSTGGQPSASRPLPSSSSSAAEARARMAPHIGKRWGFKPKATSSTVTSTSSIPPTPPTKAAAPPPPPQPSAGSSAGNTFSNDGSFFAQFQQKMKEQKEAQVPRPFVPKEEKGFDDAIQQQKMKACDAKRYFAAGPSPVSGNLPADWYQQALEKARGIAKALNKQNPSSSVNTEVKTEIKPEVKTELTEGGSGSNEYGGSLAPGPSTSTTALDSKPDQVKSEKAEEEEGDVEEEEDLCDVQLPLVAEELASMVALSESVEGVARAHNADEDQLAFLFDPSSKLYRKYRHRVRSLRKGMRAEGEAAAASASGDGQSGGTGEAGGRKRKRNRWGDEADKVDLSQPVTVTVPNSLTSITQTDPQLIQYAIKVFGSTDLTDAQWKQCEDQIKMSLVYNQMLVKKQALEKLQQKGHNKHEYDSDEDTEGGTWEHKARKLEMAKTEEKAAELTQAGKGSHHIGDFLPPEELTKFMNKYKALKSGQSIDESDYQDSKLTQENLGFKMLQRMGWSEGKGLGTEGQGITTPIGKNKPSTDNKGVGTKEAGALEAEDDEFDAYRKRMMLAYRFRPNPLNNPRRAYY